MALRPIADTLREVRGGAVLDELAEKLQEVVNAVVSTGKAGSLTLKLHIAPAKADGAMVLKDEITANVPKIESSGTLLFVTPEGNLQRKHPKQDDLPGLNVVDKKASNA